MTQQALTIGIVGGLGWLGSAITDAIVSSAELQHCSLVISSRRPKPDSLPANVIFTQDNQWLADQADMIILSVRPQDWQKLKLNAQDKIILSVMAGISIADLSLRHNTDKVIRALPNGAASIQQSYTPWIAEGPIDESQLYLVRQILRLIGTEDCCHNEDQVDFLTAISGAGPAYPALLAQALEETALQQGLNPTIARRAANAVVQGSSHLMNDLGADPKSMVEVFESYQGTTAAGLQAMKQHGFVDVISKGVNAAYQRSKHLSSS